MITVMHRPKVLLVNPPIFDFTAYDFWLRPYGMLRVAGRLRHACDFKVFDYLISENRDTWGRGNYPGEIIPKPRVLRDIPRHYRRYGLPRERFRTFLRDERFDAVLIQTGMTYWYEGVGEVLEDLRELQPRAISVLGGVYATLCSPHACSLGADLVIEGSHLQPLYEMLQVRPGNGLPYWDGSLREVGVIKLTEGCPFHCTYCSVPILYPCFRVRPVGECLEELAQLVSGGAGNVAFYDDALLFRAEEVLIPFLESVTRTGIPVSFHTPNALNARLLTPELAELMVRCGVRSFFLGLENESVEWQAKTGRKVCAEEFARAAASLRDAGARSVTAYVIIGHPDLDASSIEESMQFAHAQGVRILLSDFAPVAGTPDGERCRAWANLDEPLEHNKTAFTIRRLGFEQVNRLKVICRDLNSAL
jgi:pyruvate-formate lyase-activating enzyme